MRRARWPTCTAATRRGSPSRWRRDTPRRWPSRVSLELGETVDLREGVAADAHRPETGPDHADAQKEDADLGDEAGDEARDPGQRVVAGVATDEVPDAPELEARAEAQVDYGHQQRRWQPDAHGQAQREHHAPGAAGEEARGVTQRFAVCNSGNEARDENEHEDGDNRNRVADGHRGQAQALDEVVAEVVPRGQRVLHAVDDVANQTGDIAVDEEDADDDHAGQHEDAAEEDLLDPLRIFEDEGKRSAEVEGIRRTRRWRRRGRQFGHRG